MRKADHMLVLPPCPGTKIHSAVWLNLLVIFITMGVVAHSPPNFASALTSLGQPEGPVVKSAFVSLPLFSKVNGIMQMVFAYGGAMIFPEFMAEMRRPMDFWKAMVSDSGTGYSRPNMCNTLGFSWCLVLEKKRSRYRAFVFEVFSLIALPPGLSLSAVACRSRPRANFIPSFLSFPNCSHHETDISFLSRYESVFICFRPYPTGAFLMLPLSTSRLSNTKWCTSVSASRVREREL